MIAAIGTTEGSDGVPHAAIFATVPADRAPTSDEPRLSGPPLLRRLGRTAEAASAYEAAVARTENGAERAFLQRSRDRL